MFATRTSRHKLVYLLLLRVAQRASLGGMRTGPESFPLEQANEALDKVRAGQIRGAAVLVVG